jgi:hypothetical protein
MLMGIQSLFYSTFGVPCSIFDIGFAELTFRYSNRHSLLELNSPALVRWLVQQQCSLFWPARWPVACGLGLFRQKIGSVGAVRTTFACFGSRLASVLLLTHKAGSKHALCPLLDKQKKSKKLSVRSKAYICTLSLIQYLLQPVIYSRLLAKVEKHTPGPS